VISLAQPSEVLGELMVLGGLPRAAVLCTKGKVYLLVLGGGDFRNLLHSPPALSDQVFHMLVARLAAAGG
jgi:CRP-like cAMP-binding protein